MTTPTDYKKLFAAGGICCSFSHAVTVPIDVVKTRMQVTPGEFTGLLDGVKKIYGQRGFAGLMQGFMPTMYGFGCQGALKYGMYEFFKDRMNAKNPNYRPGMKPTIPQTIMAASMAETLGSTALVPFEAARIRMVSDPNFAKGTLGVLSKLVASQGMSSIFVGLPPILAKQIPYTVTQFLVYETTSAKVYAELNKRGITNVDHTGGTAITLGCAIVAGVTASVVSQPGDTVLTYVNKAPGVSVLQAIARLGPLGLFTGGATRCVHVTSYVVMQFLIYDSIKRLCGIPVAGSHTHTTSGALPTD
eukprot:CAMPEP_0181323066 /NCGR_PEP_ID=MMETSP1101-20121128/19577_1 /TAXON_ID=46948 /ORGANISM="Rhodomonas abbreviata, Strain Caron Lab Isolate" /LENGTH=302 /DNA_ID=CAMNT_0023431049 /DNA_START=47 /DNA_END=955 /DNA_ORIENTATION=-